MIVRRISACCCMALSGSILSCGQTGSPGTDGGSGSGSGTVSLPQSVGRFVIASGQEKQSKAVLPATTIRGASDNLTLRLDPDDISFASEDGVGGTMLFAVAFGDVSNFDEACAEPMESFSPFTITVNADGEVTGVSGSFEVDPSTVELLRTGSFTICTTYSSNVAGTIIVETLTLN